MADEEIEWTINLPLEKLRKIAEKIAKKGKYLKEWENKKQRDRCTNNDITVTSTYIKEDVGVSLIMMKKRQTSILTTQQKTCLLCREVWIDRGQRPWEIWRGAKP